VQDRHRHRQTAEATLTVLRETAPAKINLSLHVHGRRGDGLHALESLVVFAEVADDLQLVPGGELALTVDGDTAAASGPVGDNLVVKAARALSDQVPGLRLGHFHLTKRLPVAAGLGGGSADAAAALRLLARANGLATGDPRVQLAAWATGADCRVCLDPRPGLMCGAGEEVTRLARFPALDLALVNPRIAVATRDVFAALGLAPGQTSPHAAHPGFQDALGDPDEVRRLLAAARNDLAAAARSICPAIGDVERALGEAGASVVRLSGSGASVWGLAADAADARRIAATVATRNPGWWVVATRTGST